MNSGKFNRIAVGSRTCPFLSSLSSCSFPQLFGYLKNYFHLCPFLRRIYDESDKSSGVPSEGIGNTRNPSSISINSIRLSSETVGNTLKSSNESINTIRLSSEAVGNNITSSNKSINNFRNTSVLVGNNNLYNISSSNIRIASEVVGNNFNKSHNSLNEHRNSSEIFGNDDNLSTDSLRDRREQSEIVGNNLKSYSNTISDDSSYTFGNNQNFNTNPINNPIDYESICEQKLQDKHNSNSYRIFNRIGRLANDFTCAEAFSTSLKINDLKFNNILNNNVNRNNILNNNIINNNVDNKARQIFNPTHVTVWCSNDYLGMSRHPSVSAAAKAAIDKYGLGSGGTRNISGNNILHENLEYRLAAWFKKEAGLVFTSCYVANSTTLSTLGKLFENCVFFSDEGNHASLIEGIRYSKCEKVIYKHNNLADLEKKLKKYSLFNTSSNNISPLNSSLKSSVNEHFSNKSISNTQNSLNNIYNNDINNNIHNNSQIYNDQTNKLINRPKIIVFESVNSMNGSIAPIEEICKLAKKYNALTFLDEVHAIGMYGKTGSGYSEQLNCLDKVDIISGTLGKAVGTIGGFIVGNAKLVDMVRCYAPGFIFTTSLPPSIISASIESIGILQDDEGVELRKRHKESVNYVRKLITQSGFPQLPSVSHIVPLLVGDALRCNQISKILMDEFGIYVQPINYPTVKWGTERLRIAPTPGHTRESIEKLVNSLALAWESVGLEPLHPRCMETSCQCVNSCQSFIDSMRVQQCVL